jgi:hypothetical protein
VLGKLGLHENQAVAALSCNLKRNVRRRLTSSTTTGLLAESHMWLQMRVWVLVLQLNGVAGQEIR